MIYTEKESAKMHELIGAIRSFVQTSSAPETAYMKRLLEEIDAERARDGGIPTLNGTTTEQFIQD
jgi:hypothetical protein